MKTSRRIRSMIFIIGIYSHHRGIKNVGVGHLRDSNSMSSKRAVHRNNYVQPLTLQKYQPMGLQKTHIVTLDSFFLILIWKITTTCFNILLNCVTERIFPFPCLNCSFSSELAGKVLLESLFLTTQIVCLYNEYSFGKQKFSYWIRGKWMFTPEYLGSF